ncbi:DUF4198 domain-containing protein [Bordetella genomosp. 1]|uniref:DUF4198 domain-containing protein n=1 Tax=Bordetella genomosp. 1 TaxID=1395607 RepID=A0ABX4F1X0_9BORD|nr:DUF4198 domain-containing protein [Bordetella genomosp. 1]OZI65564.1 hypothetical protein CAL27_11090 [Bordetella genomosp. 1]
MRIIKSVAALALLGWTSMASAHFVWLEPAGDSKVRAYFGEWADDQREKVDGFLGKVITEPKVNGKATKPAGKGADYFEFDARADARLGQAVLFKETLVDYNARLGRQDTKGELPLEIVPTAAGSNTFVLTFEGKPLAKTEVTVFGPPKWLKQYHTDEAGKFTIETPWSGQYVLEAGHSIEKTGEHDGKPFKKVRYVTTLTFEQAK